MLYSIIWQIFVFTLTGSLLNLLNRTDWRNFDAEVNMDMNMNICFNSNATKQIDKTLDKQRTELKWNEMEWNGNLSDFYNSYHPTDGWMKLS